MKNNLWAWLAVAYLASASICPSLADPGSSNSSSKQGSINWGKLPKRAAGFVVGSLAGTPVCLVKRLANDEVEGTRALVGETKSPFLLVPAGICWLPFAGIASVFEAPFYSIQNSWLAEEPFSREQFSLEEHK